MCRGDCLLADELASPLRYLMLSVGLLSVGSCSLPLLKGVSSLRRGSDVRPRYWSTRWNHRHGLSGWSVFRSSRGHGESLRWPHVEPSGDRAVLDHGPQ
jgi:hypothetical protein